MFELPELFGSPYILPALIAVVLLLLLLLLLGSRRRRPRRATGRSSREAAKAEAAGSGTPKGEYGRGASAAGGPADTTRSGGRRTAARDTYPATTTAPVDPITAVVNDILAGWGDLTPADTNRLKVFRPDKVAAVIAAAELPRDLKNSEHARARLSQLRHHASSLPETPSEALAVTHPAMPKMDTGIDTEPAVHLPEPMELAEEEISQPEETAGEQRAAESAWGVVVGGAALYADDEASADKSGVFPAAPEVKPEEQAATQERESREEDLAILGDVDFSEIDLASVEDGSGLAPDGPDALEEESIVLEEAFEDQFEELPTVEEMADTDDTFFSLRDVVSTADQLLALPADEQAGMLAFLQPAELGKVFRATGDSQLKKSVIDMFENIGNSSALDSLRQCLDDPDPEIQLYALDAADRLLGVG